MAHPHRTVSGTMAESPLVLVDVVTDQGVTGHGIVFTYTVAALKPTMDLVKNLAPLVVHDVLAPPAIEQKLARRLRLLGTQGLVGMALSGIDMALWDAMARVHGVSLMICWVVSRGRCRLTARSDTTARWNRRRSQRIGAGASSPG